MIRTLQLLLATLLALGMVGISSAHPTLAAGTTFACPTDESALQTAINTAGSGGTVSFNCTSPTTIGFTSPIAISNSVTLDASSSSAVTFDGGGVTELFSVNPGVNLTLRHLTLTHGFSNLGGAISNHGTLTITDSNLPFNSASNGGAIYNDGTVTITNSTLQKASASFGGAISNHGTLTITDSTLYANYANQYGAAIYNYGTVTITNTAFPYNSASNGGAIYNVGLGTVTNSTFTGNFRDGGSGGAIDNEGSTLTITNSTFSENYTGYGGAILNNSDLTVTNSTFFGNSGMPRGGAIFNTSSGDATITNSTFSRNEVGTGVGYDGGAILNAGRLTIANSTLSGNSAGEGGAIYDYGDTLTITNSTVSGNYAAVNGGAIYNYLATVNIGGSILVNNGDGTCTNDDSVATIVNDQGYNLSDQFSICGTSVNTDLLGNTGAGLDTLADNGGPTQTMALLPGSQAIDGIPASNATLCPPSGTDQRGAGYARPDNSETACDIGAYEYQDAGGVTPQSQSITFGTLPDTTYGAAPFTVSATASSTLAVTFSSTTSGVCTISGNAVSIMAAGTCTIAADQAGNNDYSAAPQVQQSFTVARATLNVAANDQSMTYGGTVPTFDATSTGLVNGDTFAHLGGSCSASVNGSAASSGTAAGSYPGAITCSGVDTTNYTVTYAGGTLTVNKAPLTVTAANQGPVQYSDPMPALTAVISGFVNGQLLATSGVSGSPSCSTTAGTATVSSGQGSYTIHCAVGTLAAANYSFPPANFVDGTLTVTQETAAIQYTGGSAVMLPSTGSVSIPLSATVWDSAAKGYPSWGATDPDGLTGGTPGDVTKMSVQWSIWPAASCLSGTPAQVIGPVTVTATGTAGIGTASTTWSQSTEGSYCVVAQVVGSTANSTNQYYTANNAQVAGIAFYTNTGQFATGGGWIADSTPGGTGQGAFSVNARYTRTGGAKGQMTYVWRGMYGNQLATFSITSNTMSTLTFSGTTAPVTATLQGKATESIVSVATGQVLFSAGNLTFTATAKDGDYGKPQSLTSDVFSLTVFNGSNGAIKQIGPAPLGGGNLVVRNS